MADKKITELTELTTPAGADIVAIVDDVAGSPITKKITQSNLLGVLPSGAVDAIGEIDASLRSGSDTTLITGTAGTSGDLAEWNADGDLVDSKTPPTGDIVGTSDTQTLTNKTLTSPTLNTSVSGTAVKDEDDMASDSATALATQQSIKAYADTDGGSLGGWTDANETWTYASATTFTVGADVTDKYQKGDKIRLKQGGAYKYFYIIAVSYSSPNTTVTVTAGDDYSLASATITDNYYSKSENPQGFTQWFNYSPAQTNWNDTGGTVVARFRVIGNTVHISIHADDINITSTPPQFDGFPINGDNDSALTGSALVGGTLSKTAVAVLLTGGITGARVYKTITAGNWDGTETDVNVDVVCSYQF